MHARSELCSEGPNELLRPKFSAVACNKRREKTPYGPVGWTVTLRGREACACWTVFPLLTNAAVA